MARNHNPLVIYSTPAAPSCIMIGIGDTPMTALSKVIYIDAMHCAPQAYKSLGNKIYFGPPYKLE